MHEERHPEWQEPDEPARLPEAEYRRVLDQIDQIKSLGRLQEERTQPWITNSTHWSVERHSNAYVERGLTDMRNDEKSLPDFQVKLITAYYIHSVSGMITKKQPAYILGGEEVTFDELLLGEDRFIVSSADFKATEIGNLTTFAGAGPLY